MFDPNMSYKECLKIIAKDVYLSKRDAKRGLLEALENLYEAGVLLVRVMVWLVVLLLFPISIPLLTYIYRSLGRKLLKQ